MNKLAEEFGFVLTNNEFVPTDLFVRWTSGIYADDNPFHRAKHMRTILTGCIEKGVRPSVVVSKSKGYVIYMNKINEVNEVNEDTEATEDTDETRDALRIKQQRIDELENEVRELKGGRKRSAAQMYREPDGLSSAIQRRIDNIDEHVQITDEDLRDVIGGLVIEHGFNDDIVSNLKMRIPLAQPIFKGNNPTTAECARIANNLFNLLNIPIEMHTKVSINHRVKEVFEKSSKRPCLTNDDASSSTSAQNNPIPK